MFQADTQIMPIYVRIFQSVMLRDARIIIALLRCFGWRAHQKLNNKLFFKFKVLRNIGRYQENKLKIQLYWKDTKYILNYHSPITERSLYLFTKKFLICFP